jgi:activator of HSP90 ATPase
MCHYTSYNWSHWNFNGKLKEKSVSCTGKTFDKLTAADSCTGNGTESVESAVVWGVECGR